MYLTWNKLCQMDIQSDTNEGTMVDGIQALVDQSWALAVNVLWEIFQKIIVWIPTMWYADSKLYKWRPHDIWVHGNGDLILCTRRPQGLWSLSPGNEILNEYD